MPEQAATLLLVGTYTERLPHVDGKGAGIHLVQFDQATGLFGAATIVGGLVNPSYLAASAAGDRVYCVTEVEEARGPTVETFSLDAAAMQLSHLASTPARGSWPCHLSLNEPGRHLYVSNYASGNCTVYDLDASGVPHHQATLQRAGRGPRQEQEAAHAHCAIASPDGRHLYLCDLGTDRIARYPIRDGRLTDVHDLELIASPGAGPRHVIFTPSGAFLLGVHELASTLSLYRIEDGSADEVAVMSTVPPNWSGDNGSAAVRVHPSGRFVFASNRGHDSVLAARLDEAARTLTAIGHWTIEGRTPRDIALTPNGRFLLAASQDDATIMVFAINQTEGTLVDTGSRLRLDNPVCLCFVDPAGSPQASRP